MPKVIARLNPGCRRAIRMSSVVQTADTLGRVIAIEMLHYAIVFLVIALIAGVLGLSGVAGTASTIAYALFVVFLVIAIFSFFFKGGRKV